MKKIGNKRAFELLDAYKKSPKGLILVGRNGLGLLDIAEDTARGFLDLADTKTLDRHPDFMRIGRIEGKQSVGVDDIYPVIQKSYLLPAVAKKKVFLFEEIDRLTSEASNKLLKILEDGTDTIIIGISYTGGVLPTIKSRVTLIEFHALSEEEFQLYMEETNQEYKEYLYLATKGCPLLVESLLPHTSLLEGIYQTMLQNDRKNLFHLLHLYKEKDKEHIMEKNRDLIPILFQLIEGVAMKRFRSQDDMKSMTEIIDLVQKERMRFRSFSYAQTEFYNFILNVVTTGVV